MTWQWACLFQPGPARQLPLRSVRPARCSSPSWTRHTALSPPKSTQVNHFNKTVVKPFFLPSGNMGILLYCTSNIVKDHLGINQICCHLAIWVSHCTVLYVQCCNRSDRNKSPLILLTKDNTRRSKTKYYLTENSDKIVLLWMCVERERKIHI